MRRLLLLIPLLAHLGCVGDLGDLSASVRTARVDRDVLDLGRTLAGVPTEGSVRIFNDGEGAMQAYLSVEPADAPFILPRASVTTDRDGTDIHVQMIALELGEPRATLVIRTNDSDSRTLRVELRGAVTGVPDCNDDNVCTLDLWDGSTCTHRPVNGACDDGNACTTADRCAAGTCTGDMVTCNDGVDCTVDTCDAVLGCAFVPRNEACEDGNPCTADVCLPATGCSRAQAPDGTLCGVPACEAMPMCFSGECRTIEAPDGFPCEDGDPCTLGDSCHDGTCARGLGEPMGVGDPIVVAGPQTSPQGWNVEPADLVALQAMGGGRVRALWRSRGAGDTADRVGSFGDCAENAAFQSPRLLWLTEVDQDGNALGQQQLVPPAAGMEVLDAVAITVGDTLVVAARYRSVDPCCDTDPCPGSSLSLAIHRVPPVGGAADPLVIETFPDVQGAEDLPLAMDAHEGNLLLVTSSQYGLLCTGTCPQAVRLDARVLDPETLAELESGTVQVITPDIVAPPSHLADVSAVLTDDAAVIAWRVQGGPIAYPACGPVTGGTDYAERMVAPRGPSLGFQRVAPPGVTGSAVGVGLARGALGPALFVAHRGMSMGCQCEENVDCDCVNECSVHDEVLVEQSGAVSSVLVQDQPGGASALVKLGVGGAFGRAVAVMIHADNRVVVASPALGSLPEIRAEYTPDPSLAVTISREDSPIIIADGTRAWIGAMMTSSLPLIPTNVIAVVPAGCGVTPGGSIHIAVADGGVPVEDAGPSGGDGGPGDAGSADAGRADADAGSAEDAGTRPDGGPAVDAGDAFTVDAGSPIVEGTPDAG